MKKKVVALLFSLALAVSCSACTNQAQQPGNGAYGEEQSISGEVQSGESADMSGEGSGASASSASGESGEGNGDAGVVRVYAPKLLNTGYEDGDDKLYMLDESGSKITEYDWAQIKRELHDKGYDFDSETIETTDGQNVYLYQYDETQDGYRQSVYAVDLAKKEAAKIYTTENSQYIESIDVYQDLVYVDCYYYDDQYHYREHAFEKDGNGFSYHEVETGSKALWDALDLCTTVWTSSAEADQNDSRCSLARSFDENGCVIARQKGGTYVRILPDGMIKTISYEHSDEGYEDVKAFDAEFCIIEKTDADWATHICVYDFAAGITAIEITAGEGYDVSYLDYADGCLYYCESEEENYIYKTNRIFQMNLRDGNGEGRVKKLYEAKTVPGAASIGPGTQKFQVTNGVIFYAGIENGDLRWYRKELNDSPAKVIGSTIEKVSVFQYGSVIYDTYLGKCELCGIPMEKYYGEAFQLSSQYSQYADKINESLAGDLKQVIAGYQEVNPDYVPDPEECEYHREMPYAYCETVEDYVGDVSILSDHYLIVDTNGYWYGGGAHGQYYIGQYVFDLANGERMRLKDFYKGSQEEFKKLMATKTQKDFESYDEDESPYFSSDPDEIYNQAYEYADLETTQIIFAEDAAYLEYEPYMMGPYAAGYIEIKISYEELLGRSGL